MPSTAEGSQDTVETVASNLQDIAHKAQPHEVLQYSTTKTDDEYYTAEYGNSNVSSDDDDGSSGQQEKYKPEEIKEFDNSYLAVVKPRLWNHIEVGGVLMCVDGGVPDGRSAQTAGGVLGYICVH